MAGISTYPFASQCLDYGTDLAWAPMVHTDFVLNNLDEALKVVDFSRHPERSEGSRDSSLKTQSDISYIVQLVGSEPKKFAESIKLLSKHVKPLGYDLNTGCPDRNIVKSGCGGTLMQKPALVVDIVKAMKSATNLPISVKTRAGFDNYEDVYGLVELLNKEQVSMLTIHPRKVTQMYAGTADYQVIKRAQEITDIPIVASGDVRSFQEAHEKVKEYGLAGIMIGRGALGRPWIFKEIKDKKDYKPSLKEVKELVTDLSEKSDATWGNKGIIEARKHFAWYLKGYPGAKELRSKLMQANTLEDVYALLK